MNLFFKFLILFLLIIPSVYSIETVQIDTKGVTVEMAEKNSINLEIVESSSLRIGNPREDSTEIYKITALDIGNISITLRIGKKDNATVSLGQERKYDFDKDNVFDAGIILSNLRPGRATLVFKSLEGKIEALDINTSSNNITVDNNFESKKVNENKLTTNTQISSEKNNEEVELIIDHNIISVSKSSYRNIIVLISLAVVLLSLVSFLVYKKFKN